MTDKEWEEKLEPFAQMLYDMHMGLFKESKKLEKKIVKEFGAVEAYVSVVDNGVRILISPTSTERVSVRFRFEDAG